jgi:hypothetical protein
MTRNRWIRQFHRWTAVAFTVTIAVAFAAVAQENPAPWAYYGPLLPLALLLLTGLYLFALPHAARRRSRRRTAPAK